MSASDAFENAILLLIFNNDDFLKIGDAGGLLQSVGEGSLYVSLHTADPGEAGDQTTNEGAYTGYARVAVGRNVGGWTVAAENVSNAAAVTFGVCTAGPETVTHFGIGTDAAGAGVLLFSAALTDSLDITAAPPITPYFPIGDLDVDCA